MPPTSTDVEVRQYTYWGYTSAMGRSRITIVCPFCQADVVAYLWSLAGCGKRCECGAKFNQLGEARKARSS